MRKKQILIVLWLLIVSAFTSPMIGNAQTSQTILEIVPEETRVSEIGYEFTVNIDIIDVSYLFAMQFVLRYDPNILSVVDVSSGTFPAPAPPHDEVSWVLDKEWTGLPTTWDGYDCDVWQDGILDIYDWPGLALSWCYFWFEPRYNPRADIDNDGHVGMYDIVCWFTGLNYFTGVYKPGTIQFYLLESALWSPGGLVGYWGTGSGTLATVTFEVIGCGRTLLDLDNTKLSTPNIVPIAHQVRDGTVIVPPKKPIQDLTTTIEEWDLPKGVENCLTSQLQEAANLLEMENDNGAVHKMIDFMNRVEASRGKKLTDEQADQLIAEAQAIIDMIEG